MLKSKKTKDLDIDKIDLKDKKVFNLLSTGKTTGLFQIESAGMREAIKQMQPNKFDDIIALVALYRPGPMSNIPIYNDCKNGIKNQIIYMKLRKNFKTNLWNNYISRTSNANCTNTCRLYGR